MSRLLIVFLLSGCAAKPALVHCLDGQLAAYCNNGHPAERK